MSATGENAAAVARELVGQLTRDARAAARALAIAPTLVKDIALRRAAGGLRERAEELVTANRRDLAVALVAGLPDPVGETAARWRRPNGLEITQLRVALGVIGVIYESRPNVTAD